MAIVTNNYFDAVSVIQIAVPPRSVPAIVTPTVPDETQVHIDNRPNWGLDCTHTSPHKVNDGIQHWKVI